MIAPLLIAERLEARALAANAVRSAFFERFGEHPSGDDRLWQIDPLARLDFVGDVELIVGKALRCASETVADVLARLMGGGAIERALFNAKTKSYGLRIVPLDERDMRGAGRNHVTAEEFE